MPHYVLTTLLLTMCCGSTNKHLTLRWCQVNMRAVKMCGLTMHTITCLCWQLCARLESGSADFVAVMRHSCILYLPSSVCTLLLGWGLADKQCVGRCQVCLQMLSCCVKLWHSIGWVAKILLPELQRAL
jgi:hypothetical protein